MATPKITADETRGEVLLTIDNEPRVVRFGLKFLKAFTGQKGADGPTAALAAMAESPVDELLDMVALAVRLSVPDLADFTSAKALDVVDELSAADQQHIFSVLMNSIHANPLVAALKSIKAAE